MVKHTRLAALSLVCATASSALWSCDVDPFGWGSKSIAAGYRLVRTDDAHDCGLFAPGEDHGSIVSEVGWQKPLIIARAWRGKDWQVVDTTRHARSSISDAQRRSESPYREITTYDAMEAWQLLHKRRSVW